MEGATLSRQVPPPTEQTTRITDFFFLAHRIRSLSLYFSDNRFQRRAAAEEEKYSQ